MRQAACVCYAVLLALPIGSPLFTGRQAREPRNEAVISKALPASPLAVVLATDCGVDATGESGCRHVA